MKEETNSLFYRNFLSTAIVNVFKVIKCYTLGNPEETSRRVLQFFIYRITVKTDHECRLILFIFGQNYDKNDWMPTTGCFQVWPLKAAHQISAIQNCRIKVSRYGKDMVIRGYFWPFRCLLMYVHELLLFGSREGVREGENVSERIIERERESKGQMLRLKE